MFVADAPDDSMLIALGSTWDGELPPIVGIDWNSKTYKRFGQEAMPFPERWHRDSDLKWEPVTL